MDVKGVPEPETHGALGRPRPRLTPFQRGESSPTLQLHLTEIDLSEPVNLTHIRVTPPESLPREPDLSHYRTPVGEPPEGRESLNRRRNLGNRFQLPVAFHLAHPR
jgi:hypothetical protein